MRSAKSLQISGDTFMQCVCVCVCEICLYLQVMKQTMILKLRYRPKQRLIGCHKEVQEPPKKAIPPALSSSGTSESLSDLF